MFLWNTAPPGKGTLSLSLARHSATPHGGKVANL